MPSPFDNSIFFDLVCKKSRNQSTPTAILGGISGSSFASETPLSQIPFVVFDFETTGVDHRNDRIIEVGAVRFENRKEVARFSQLINPGIKLPPEIIEITGIDDAMLIDAPSADRVIPSLHDFMRGAVGVAHNAEFDANFLSYESLRLGIQCNYHILCTLKLSRALLKLPRYKLDSLAQHYGLTFESRHRSIGDILVTAEVLWRILDENKTIKTLSDIAPYKQEMIQI
jgi:DNA polymerase III epsilon subunit family exonuclease